MEMVRRDCESGVFGADVELAPKRVDIFLLVRKASVFHHVVAGSGVGTIGSYQKVEIHRNFRRSILLLILSFFLGWVLSTICCGSLMMLLEPSRSFVEVCTCKLVIEVQIYIRHFLERIQEAFVETCAIYRFDVLESLIRSELY